MVSVFDLIVLGAVQGLTEWLPVSSSAHLAVFSHFFGMSADMFLYVMLHLGTLMSVIVFFRKDIMSMAGSAIRLDFSSGYGRLGLMIIIGTLPALVAGFALYNTVSRSFSSMPHIGLFLMATGAVLFSTKFIHGGRRDISSKDALVIGLVQALSIFPGISRSGITVSTALAREVDRKSAFTFSFLLSVPVILGANLYEIYKYALGGGLQAAYAVSYGTVAGCVTAFLVGYFALAWLRKMIIGGKLHYFAYYCWALGIVLLLSGG